MIPQNDLQTIKAWLTTSQAIVINTGAGMGVDSGLPDFRGDDGIWGKVEGENQQSIFELSNPKSFEENPQMIWTLFAKRMKSYQATTPHQGFQILLQWIAKLNLDYFVLTSNIDSQFQKAGFAEDKIRELHGSLAYLQSTQPELSKKIWKNELEIDQLLQEIQNGIFPICPVSKVMARPNVYMFRDFTYIDTRSKAQEQNFQAFLQKNQNKNLLVFEIGSGPHVQTIRVKTRMLKSDYNAKIVRINPKDYAIKPPHIGIAEGALVALKEIDEYIFG